jgi:hypothetical protein
MQVAGQTGMDLPSARDLEIPLRLSSRQRYVYMLVYYRVER